MIFSSLHIFPAVIHLLPLVALKTDRGEISISIASIINGKFALKC